jgi:hypothetical protein
MLTSTPSGHLIHCPLTSVYSLHFCCTALSLHGRRYTHCSFHCTHCSLHSLLFSSALHSPLFSFLSLLFLRTRTASTMFGTLTAMFGALASLQGIAILHRVCAQTQASHPTVLDPSHSRPLPTSRQARTSVQCSATMQCCREPQKQAPSMD